MILLAADVEEKPWDKVFGMSKSGAKKSVFWFAITGGCSYNFRCLEQMKTPV
jgi:hypothetical protein